MPATCSRALTPLAAALAKSRNSKRHLLETATVRLGMLIASALGRMLVIAVSAFVTAVGAGMALVAGTSVRAWLAMESTPPANIPQVADEMWGIGLVTGEFLGPFGALFALPILWRSQLRKSVPSTAAVTIAAAAMSGLVAFPSDAGPAAALVTTLVAFGAAVLTMLVCAERWRLASIGQQAKRPSPRLSSPAEFASPGSAGPGASVRRAQPRKAAAPTKQAPAA